MARTNLNRQSASSTKRSTSRHVRPSPKSQAQAPSGADVSKPWGGRFHGSTHRLVEAFTVSLSFDHRLYDHDIQGSIAHCETLRRAKVLTRQESSRIIRGLRRIRTEIQQGQFSFKNEDEDIHMSVERRLIQLIGPLGGKLHTGRSRNDQITLDLRLYLRDSLALLSAHLQKLQHALVIQARKHISVIMPGYTHLQRAQPVLFAHHLLAYVEMFERDKGRIQDTRTRLNVMPLGSGALAGTNYPLDRRFTAKLLNFPALTTNSLDAVSDRDFVIEALNALSILMMHLSRMSEEFVLWSSEEFHFIDLPDSFCTGSSMMPQKKNPDIPELVRGKTGRVFGDLIAVLTTMKGLPLSYNRDLQEDKTPIFDALDTTLSCVEIYTHLIKRLKIRRDAMAKATESGLFLATELADYLVKKGVPFREAHGIVGQLVRECVEQNKDPLDLTLTQYRSFSSHFDRDVLSILTPEKAVDRKAQIGGTARNQVEARLIILEKSF